MTLSNMAHANEELIELLPHLHILPLHIFPWHLNLPTMLLPSFVIPRFTENRRFKCHLIWFFCKLRFILGHAIVLMSFNLRVMQSITNTDAINFHLQTSRRQVSLREDFLRDISLSNHICSSFDASTTVTATQCRWLERAILIDCLKSMFTLFELHVFDTFSVEVVMDRAL